MKTSSRLSRRIFLRGTGVAMALPMLDAMAPTAISAPTKGSAQAPDERRRMVTICTGLGVHAPFLFPEKAGRDYKITPYLKTIEKLRDQFTILSGVSHPGVDGGHASEASFLTAAAHPNSSSFKNTISLDQIAAEQLGGKTRFDYLALSTGNYGLSWSRSGVRIPSEYRPSRIFANLFLNGTPDQVNQQVRKIKDGQSIMDTVRGQAKSMQRNLATSDRNKLDQYFTSVRELEKRLIKAEQWARKPKPKVEMAPPQDIADRTDLVGKQKLMYELMYLALQTDSTRLITLMFNGLNLVPPIEGVTIDWHNLSHHGKDESKISQLKIIEMEEFKLFAQFLTKLHETKEQGKTLLDQTMVLLGSNLGNASSHDTRNMPIILAGGGFKHGQHLAFDHKRNYPLPKLYVSMLQRLGIETDSFATVKGTMDGLEIG